MKTLTSILYKKYTFVTKFKDLPPSLGTLKENIDALSSAAIKLVAIKIKLADKIVIYTQIFINVVLLWKCIERTNYPKSSLLSCMNVEISCNGHIYKQYWSQKGQVIVHIHVHMCHTYIMA